MAASESIGTTLAASAGSIASYTSSGYAALSFTDCGEVREVPQYGPSADVVEHTPLATGIKNKFHGAIDYGSLQVPLAWDTSDGGQDILRAAFASKAEIHFEVTYPSGDVEYFTGKVMGLPRGASVNEVWLGSVAIEVTRAIVSVDAA